LDQEVKYGGLLGVGKIRLNQGMKENALERAGGRVIGEEIERHRVALAYHQRIGLGQGYEI